MPLKPVMLLKAMPRKSSPDIKNDKKAPLNREL